MGECENGEGDTGDVGERNMTRARKMNGMGAVIYFQSKKDTKTIK